MNLTELGSIDGSRLPLKRLADHLRLGTAFVETSLQDDLLDVLCRAAISTLEGRLGIAIFSRDFAWNVTSWRDDDRFYLPIRPVNSLVRIVSFTSQDEETQLDETNFALFKDQLCPSVNVVGSLPAIPKGGSITVEFNAGFSDEWDGVPGDLQQAVIQLAAHFYENRSGMGATCLPSSVSLLIAPYSKIRLGGARV